MYIHTIFPSKGDSDYAPLSMSRLTFDASGTMQCVNIGINNDTLYEINESFNAIASSDDPAAHFNTNTSTITIQDNNSKYSILVSLFY